VKAKEWIWIPQEMQHRGALGKQSTAYLHNKPLPNHRVVRETARHENKGPFATTRHRKYTNEKPLLGLLI
jgi:hypothetical protein